MNAQAFEWMNALANASFLWGPFFFSILFILVVTRTAHKYYAEVNARVNPPAPEDEKKCYRLNFLATVCVGIVLVFLSVGWWMFAQLTKHTFEGVILGLNPGQSISAETDDELYLQVRQRPGGNGRMLLDYRFVIIRETPFIKGQIFRLAFYETNLGDIGNKPEPVPLDIRHSGATKTLHRYRLERSGTALRLVSTE